MSLNAFGRVVEQTWLDLVHHIDGIRLHAFIIMPNHVHGIIEIVPGQKTNSQPIGKQTPVSEIVRQLKTFSARKINAMRNTPGSSLWQRNYYEHVIRDEQSFRAISEYINHNPTNWRDDKYFNMISTD